jgi:hypothetical protein
MFQHKLIFLKSFNNFYKLCLVPAPRVYKSFFWFYYDEVNKNFFFCFDFLKIKKILEYSKFLNPDNFLKLFKNPFLESTTFIIEVKKLLNYYNSTHNGKLVIRRQKFSIIPVNSWWTQDLLNFHEELAYKAQQLRKLQAQLLAKKRKEEREERKRLARLERIKKTRHYYDKSYKI